MKPEPKEMSAERRKLLATVWDSGDESAGGLVRYQVRLRHRLIIYNTGSWDMAEQLAYAVNAEVFEFEREAAAHISHLERRLVEWQETAVERQKYCDHWANQAETAAQESASLREALQTIADWPFNIMGDCVKDARDLARAALAAPAPSPEHLTPKEAARQITDIIFGPESAPSPELRFIPISGAEQQIARQADDEIDGSAKLCADCGFQGEFAQFFTGATNHLPEAEELAYKTWSLFNSNGSREAWESMHPEIIKSWRLSAERFLAALAALTGERRNNG